MRLRTQTLLVLIVCSVGGLGLALVLANGSHSVEMRTQEVSTEAVVEREIEYLKTLAAQWFVSVDLVLGAGQSYVSAGALQQSDEIRRMVAGLRKAEFTRESQQRLLTIDVATERVSQWIEEAATLDGEDRKQRLDALLTRADGETSRLTRALSRLEQNTALRSREVVIALEETRAQFPNIVLILTTAYLITIVAVWRWSLRSVVTPLQQLESAARRSLEHPVPFTMMAAGPKEVRSLTHHVHTLVQSLESKVTERTLALESSNRDLADERARAEAGSAAKSQFLANMSHEIRTPLNGVIGIATILEKAELTEEQRELVGTIRSSGDTLLEIVNDILDLSKIHAARLELDPVDVELGSLLHDLAELLAPHPQAKGIDVICSVPPGTLTVLTDPGRLKQVLLNLLGNAVKFTDAGEVMLALEVLEERDDSVRIRFFVRDTGIGIDPEKQAHVFGAFSQADASTTRCYGGTGLGLSISSQLVSLFGGELKVSSLPGQGSTFSFEFDCARSTFPTPEPPAHARSMRCLVIDDNETTRGVLRAHLESAGHLVDEADGVADISIRLMEGHDGTPFDLVLLDQGILELDGNLSTQTVYSVFEDSVPIIFMTSMASPKSPPQLSNPSALLNKPIRPHRLLSLVAEFAGPTEGQSRARPSVRMRPEDETIDDDRRERIVTEDREVKLLVVDDNAVNRMVALKILQSLGLDADMATNGQEACEKIETSPYDLVLMDCQMPVMDGYEATREIRRKEHDGQRMPIVAMTASAMPEDKAKALASGMDDYLTKPVDRDGFAKTLRTWLQDTNAPQQRA